MNQGRIWCVVSPTVGLPLFLGSVAVTSLIVHASVMTHTTWMSRYWSGADRARVADASTVTPAVATANGVTVTITPVAATESAPASFALAVTPTTDPAITAPPAPFKAASAD